MKNPRNRLQHLWLSLHKSRTRFRVIGVLAVAAAALSSSGCESLRGVVDGMHKPEVRVASTELEALSFSGLTLRFDVEIENPNPIGISLAGFDYELQIEGNSFVSGEVDERIAVEARGSSIVPLPVELAFENIVNAFSQLEGQEEAAYQLSSGFSFDLPMLGRVRIPVQKAGTFPILRRPRLEVVSLRLNQISLSGADLSLDLELSNRNDFKVFIQALDYRFRVDGRDWVSGMRQERVRLSEYGSARMTIPIELDFAAVGRSVYQLLLGGESLMYSLEATLDVGTSLRALEKACLPFALNGQLRIQR